MIMNTYILKTLFEEGGEETTAFRQESDDLAVGDSIEHLKGHEHILSTAYLERVTGTGINDAGLEHVSSFCSEEHQNRPAIWPDVYFSNGKIIEAYTVVKRG